MLNPFQEPVDSFLNSLTYWQTINLGSVLIKSGHPELTMAEAKEQASMKWSLDNKNLKFELEKALNSPE